VKSIDDLYAVIAFFEERRGRLHAFRWRDSTDCKSCAPSATPAPTDQVIGSGDGQTASFQLVKAYGSEFAPWQRTIAKPVADSVRVAVDGVELTKGTAFTCDTETGVVTFNTGHIPAANAVITAGYEFDVPVRFDIDRLEISLDGFRHGSIPNIPVVEVRL
jgi:uncharacterized protein (TIGR02217 family)